MAARVEAARRAALAETEARQRRAESISMPLSGLAHCYQTTLEIDRLEMDAMAGRVIVSFRPADLETPAWQQGVAEILEIEPPGNYVMQGPMFEAPIRVRHHDGATRLEAEGCTFALHPHGNVPADVLAHRAERAAALTRLDIGPVRTRFVVNGGERAATAEILALAENGFRLRISHPPFVNGMFNGSDEYRSTTTLEVRLLDPPVASLVSGTIEGWGDPLSSTRCPLSVTVLADGTLAIGSANSYRCSHQITLMPDAQPG